MGVMTAWLRRRGARLADDLTRHARLSLIVIVPLMAWAMQMAQWHWLDRPGDWRGWVGFLCGWTAAWILQAVIDEGRGWLAQRAKRKAAAAGQAAAHP